jgi:DNA-binding transcriptional LysR family regulator
LLLPEQQSADLVRCRETNVSATRGRPPIQLDQLRAFRAVAHARNVTTAARALGLSQPATSRAIAALENAVGTKLITRQSRGVELTDAGAALVERVDGILDALERLAVPESDATDDATDLVIACQDHVATHLLPRAIEVLARERPRVRPRILAGPVRFVTDVVRAGDAEMGIVIGGGRDAQLARREIGRVRCQLVIAPDAPASARVRFIGSREVDAPENKAYPTVAFLKERVPGMTIALSCTSLEAHKALVCAGFGVSIVPRFVVEEELARGTLALFQKSYVYVAAVELVARPDARLSQAARIVLRVLEPQLDCRLAVGPQYRGRPVGEHPRKGSRRRAGRYGSAP